MDIYKDTENYLAEQGFNLNEGRFFYRYFKDRIEVTIEDIHINTELIVYLDDNKPFDFIIL